MTTFRRDLKLIVCRRPKRREQSAKKEKPSDYLALARSLTVVIDLDHNKVLNDKDIKTALDFHKVLDYFGVCSTSCCRLHATETGLCVLCNKLKKSSKN